jgi:POT family proton-dependent oligopeptide transporter
MTLRGGQSLTETRTGFPPQIKYIVGNEACERFSFYGMRAILVVFMMRSLQMAAPEAKAVYHDFVMACYFFPLLGGYLSDRFLGKYRTIMWLSIVYCIGHAVLAIFETKHGLYAGLALIALGSGGIKPCVSAHVGDQFGPHNRHLLEKVYEIFYFSINFGSFFSTMLTPWLLNKYGPSVAFGVPGILMAIATLLFWLGRKQFVIVPPTGAENSAKFWGVLFYSLTHQGDRKPGEGFFDVALAKYGAERIEGAKAVVDVFKVLIAISAFWALYDQHGSSWIVQATQMDRNVLGIQFDAAQIAALNPVMVMVLIPLFRFGIYPFVEKGLKIPLTPLRKMGVGMFLTGASFVIVGILQSLIDRGQNISVAWQIVPYLVITTAEILVSIVGLEFAYTQAPKAMKSTIMSLFLLTVAVGNFFTARVSALNPFKGASEFYFYAAMMFVVSFVFIALATRYRYRNYVAQV